MSSYRISRQADADLEGIVDYIADFNPTAAFDVLDSLYDTFAFLARNPEAGTLRDDLRSNILGYVRMPCRTVPCTSVRRNSRPA